MGSCTVPEKGIREEKEKFASLPNTLLALQSMAIVCLGGSCGSSWPSKLMRHIDGAVAGSTQP